VALVKEFGVEFAAPVDVEATGQGFLGQDRTIARADEAEEEEETEGDGAKESLDHGTIVYECR
jgi:hypothetical protein